LFILLALPGGIDPHLAQSLLMLHSLLSMWTHENEELAISIVKKGILIEHIDQLCMLKRSSMVSNSLLVTSFVSALRC
jgi:hypothetical protein